MNGNRLMRLTRWLAGMLALAWLLGALPLVPSPIDQAQAGFFDKVKGKTGQTQTEKAPAPSPPATAPSPPASSSAPKSGGFFKPVTKQPAPYMPAPTPVPAAPKPTPAPAPSYRPPAPGGVFGAVKDGARPPTVSPPAPRGGAQDSVFYQVPRNGWKDDSKAVVGTITSAPRYGWTSRGYFDVLHREAQERYYREQYRNRYWYYPYDYYYYRWQRYHIVPVVVWPYGYGTYQYYYAAPAVVVVMEPDDWVQGETYIPYVNWPSEELMQAQSDIEEAWRHEQIELIDRHLDPDHKIASYLRDEYTHSLTADEFRQLTLDAFSSIRTRNFDITSVRYVSTRDWARLKGKHIFYDPYDNPTTVYLSYLVRRIEDEYGRYRWVIWEVRQSPEPY
jgi:hypothetical protein